MATATNARRRNRSLASGDPPSYRARLARSGTAAPCCKGLSNLRWPRFKLRLNIAISSSPRWSRPDEPPPTVKDCVLQAGASEVGVALCREYLWVRILGASEPPDLLFKLESPTKDQPSAE